MAGWLAPVAVGVLLGRSGKGSQVIRAKAKASLAASGTPKLEEGRISICAERWDALKRAPTTWLPRTENSWAWINGFLAPPPEMISWWILVLGRTKRFRASTTESAV